MLVLASASAGRRQLLENAGVSHDVMTAQIDEDAEKARLRADGLGAGALADALAWLKARQVSIQRPGDMILGCDQTLARDDGILFDKPRDREELVQQLHALSGRGHSLHSAMVIAENGIAVWRHAEEVRMAMRTLSGDFIDRYLASEGDALLGCVGGYRIEGRGAQLFSRIEGSHFAIIGLPLLPLLDYLRTRGILAS